MMASAFKRRSNGCNSADSCAHLFAEQVKVGDMVDQVKAFFKEHEYVIAGIPTLWGHKDSRRSASDWDVFMYFILGCDKPKPRIDLSGVVPPNHRHQRRLACLHGLCCAPVPERLARLASFRFVSFLTSRLAS